MQTHYGFIYSTEFDGKLKTPFKFRDQFIVYSQIDKYPRKKEVESFLRGNYSSIPYSNVMVCKTKKPYKLAGDFVIPSRNNMVRFLNLLRVIKPNNSFLKFEAFHTGTQFQHSTLHESDEIPHFLSIKKDAEIVASDIQLLDKCISCIKRLKFDQQHRVNNFYGYLDYCVKGDINHRIIWMFIALESLFHLWHERRYTEDLCKRAAFFIEPSDQKNREKVYDVLFQSADLRGRMVHGGQVDNKKIKDKLVELEPIIWGIGNSLLTNKKHLKLFSSLDNKLERYFDKIDRQTI